MKGLVMNEQFLGILRAVLSAAGGFLIGKGYVTAEMWAWIGGGVLTIGPSIWSWVTNRPAAIAAKAQAIDGVNVQVAGSAPEAIKTAVANAKAAG